MIRTNNLVLLLLFCLFLPGCTTLGMYNPATEKREFLLISTSDEVSMGQEIHNSLLKEYELSKDEDKNQLLNKIGSRVAQVSDRQDYEYQFFVIQDKELNAFTTPGGNIYFNSGLLDKLETEDQIAGVLAHEIGHCAARHTAKKFQAALGYNLVSNIVFSVLGLEDTTSKIASMGTGVMANMIFSAYSRKDEYEADKLSVKYMYLAGYNSEGMVEAFEILKKESKESKGFIYFRTHPYIDDRIAALKIEIPKVREKYNSF